MILVDTNVILDIFTADPRWAAWSSLQLQACIEKGPLRINEIAYAEIAVYVARQRDLDRALSELRVEIERAPREALFLAGKVFGRYRAAGGPRTSLIPDFLIGAHAQVTNTPLLTRDQRRFRTYFPGVRLIVPEAP